MQGLEEDSVDKRTKRLKELSLVNNLHKITPQIQKDSEKEDVAIIKALRSSGLVESLILKLEGLRYDHTERKYVSYRRPVMNKLGIGNFVSVISTIAESVEFSNFKEKEIPKLALSLFKTNYPYFTVYYEDYQLDRKDFNLIATVLLSFILSSLNKAKGAGHRNVVRGTYSEDLLGRYVAEQEKREKSRGGLSKYNPFKKSGDI